MRANPDTGALRESDGACARPALTRSWASPPQTVHSGVRACVEHTRTRLPYFSTQLASGRDVATAARATAARLCKIVSEVRPAAPAASAGAAVASVDGDPSPLTNDLLRLGRSRHYTRTRARRAAPVDHDAPHVRHSGRHRAARGAAGRQRREERAACDCRRRQAPRAHRRHGQAHPPPRARLEHHRGTRRDAAQCPARTKCCRTAPRGITRRECGSFRGKRGGSQRGLRWTPKVRWTPMGRPAPRLRRHPRAMHLPHAPTSVAGACELPRASPRGRRAYAPRMSSPSEGALGPQDCCRVSGARYGAPCAQRHQGAPLPRHGRIPVGL